MWSQTNLHGKLCASLAKDAQLLLTVCISCLIFNLLLPVHWEVLLTSAHIQLQRPTGWIYDVTVIWDGTCSTLAAFTCDLSWHKHHNLTKCSYNIHTTFFRFCMTSHAFCTCLCNGFWNWCLLSSVLFSIAATHLLCPGSEFPVHILYELMSLRGRRRHLFQSASAVRYKNLCHCRPKRNNTTSREWCSRYQSF